MENKKKVLKLMSVVTACFLSGGIVGGILGYMVATEESGVLSYVPDNGGMVVTVPEDDGLISLKTVKLSSVDYEESGISALAETAYTITATVSPTTAIDADLEWTVAWASGTTWGSSKTVTDYVTVTPSSDTLSATVECFQAFGAQIIITACIRSNTSVSATATVDYARRVSSVTASATGKYGTVTVGYGGGITYLSSAEFGSSVSLTYTPTYSYSSVYTITDTFTYSFTVTGISSSFVTALKAYAATHTYYLNNTKVKAMVDGVGSLSTIPMTFDFTCLTQVYYAISSGYRSNYTDSTAVSQFNALMAGFQSTNENWRYGIFELEITAAGTYSTYTSTFNIGYANGVFGERATSVTFDETSFVF